MASSERVKPTLSEQRESVSFAICSADDALKPALRQALQTLEWLEARSALVKEVVRLDQHAPELAAVLREFPGAQITNVAAVPSIASLEGLKTERSYVEQLLTKVAPSSWGTAHHMWQTRLEELDAKIAQITGVK